MDPFHHGQSPAGEWVDASWICTSLIIFLSETLETCFGEEPNVCTLLGSLCGQITGG